MTRYEFQSRACTGLKCSINFSCDLFQGWNLIKAGCRVDEGAQKLKCCLIFERVNVG